MGEERDDGDDEQDAPRNGWSWVCQMCGGDGVEIRQRAAIFREGTGTASTPENCRACDGTGRIPAHE